MKYLKSFKLFENNNIKTLPKVYSLSSLDIPDKLLTEIYTHLKKEYTSNDKLYYFRSRSPMYMILPTAGDQINDTSIDYEYTSEEDGGIENDDKLLYYNHNYSVSLITSIYETDKALNTNLIHTKFKSIDTLIEHNVSTDYDNLEDSTEEIIIMSESDLNIFYQYLHDPIILKNEIIPSEKASQKIKNEIKDILEKFFPKAVINYNKYILEETDLWNNSLSYEKNIELALNQNANLKNVLFNASNYNTEIYNLDSLGLI